MADLQERDLSGISGRKPPPGEGQKEPPRQDVDGEHRGGTKDTELNGRLARYADARKRSLSMQAYLVEHISGQSRIQKKASFARRAAERLKQCGDWLRFRYYYTIGECFLVHACFCEQHLICPLCAIRRGARAVSRYVERVDQVTAQRPAMRAFLLTLTVRNGPDLGERVKHLQDSWRKATQRLRNARRGKTSSVFGSIAGAVFSIEVTKSENGWHPHLHAYVLSEEGFDLDEKGRCQALIDEWRDITGDSFIVDARPIEGDQGKGLVEVLKYAVKFSSLTLEDNWQAYKVLAGRRLLGSLGCLYGVKLPETLEDDIPEEDLPYVDLLFRFLPGSGVYTYHRAETERSA